MCIRDSDWGVHLIDRIVQMNKSKIKQVFCQVINLTGTDVDEGFNLTLIFEDGFVAYIESGAGHFDSPTPGLRLNGTTAGSYTHLDVYKRQGGGIGLSPLELVRM